MSVLSRTYVYACMSVHLVYAFMFLSVLPHVGADTHTCTRSPPDTQGLPGAALSFF